MTPFLTKEIYDFLKEALDEMDFETAHTKALIIRMDTLKQFATEKNGVFTYQNTFYESQSYGLFVTSNETKGDSIFYTLEVIPDAFPSISITEVIDSNDHYLRF